MTDNNSARNVDGLVNRARGALVGLAIGDALGATLEFAPFSSTRLHAEMTGGGPFNLNAGEWTDDTAMALALADCLLVDQTFIPQSFMERLVSWIREGAFTCQGRCIDVGETTLAAIEYYECRKVANAGSKHKNTAGNGSLVRLAPIVLFSLGSESQAVALGEAQSRVTHAAPQALGTCKYFSSVLHRAITNSADPLAPRQVWGNPAAMRLAAGSFLRKSAQELNPSGYVIDTAEVAMWAVANSNNFEDAVVKAVSLGGDADSIGAVTGQLAGALYGYSAIPNRWLQKLSWHSTIRLVADELVHLSLA